MKVSDLKKEHNISYTNYYFPNNNISSSLQQTKGRLLSNRLSVLDDPRLSGLPFHILYRLSLNSGVFSPNNRASNKHKVQSIASRLRNYRLTTSKQIILTASIILIAFTITEQFRCYECCIIVSKCFGYA
ncbi:hypothetical protein CEXT_191001 [Caerostris extrusa]|uniref:Uncharacterized protein n=1 Tax=Caerostris extrusa TaxID=172846 RepID=A0AAV4P759_CAEEX|nr:hypothetical protein CEXT_191001 [Caerostris extrusa]